MNKLFSMVVKLVVPASDKQQAENDALPHIILAGRKSGWIITDWGFVKNADGTVPEPAELPIPIDEYQEGDAFREEKVPATTEKPAVIDFVKRWLPEEERHRLTNVDELHRIERMMMSDEKDGSGKYIDDAYRLWVEEFDQDLAVVAFEIKNTYYNLMRLAIQNYLDSTQQ